MKKENKNYARIPNYFFYDEGSFLKAIGGRDSFVLYCLITSRKGMNDKVYISIRQINEVIKISNNITYARNKIMNYLENLQEYNLISFEFDIDSINNNDTMCIKWNDLFKDSNGWIAFYPDDFEIQHKIGNIPYCTMWMLRMYINNNTGTSYPSIRDIAKTLKCDIIKVQNSIDLFSKAELFQIQRGNYYYNKSLERFIRMNNEYIYTGNIDKLLDMSDEEIFNILNKNINNHVNKKHSL